jgi:hypothetical protein
MFVLQRQGFIYHLLPFGLFVSISIGGFALLLLDRSSVLKSASPVVLSTTLALAIIAGASATAAPKPELSRASVLEDPLGRALRQLPARTPVLILSTGVPPQSPNHAYADIRWTGAFGALTEMAAIVKDRDAARKEGRPRVPALVAVEQDLRRRVLLSLAAPHPEMIFIDVSPTLRWFEHYDRPIGILSFLREDPRFTAAWSDYEFQTEMPTLFGTTVKAYKRR